MNPGIDSLSLALEIVDEVQNLDGEQCERRIEELCQGKERLAQQVRALLSGPPSDFLGKPHVAMPWSRGGPGLPGSIVLDDKYELLECIGSGSMGVVYRGRHLQLDKDVAIKFVLSSNHSTPEELGRLVHEARAAAGVLHENVVAVHDVGLSENYPYMIMDWVDGVDLHQWLLAANDGQAGQVPTLPEFMEAKLNQGCQGPLWERPYAEIVAFVVMKIARAVATAHRKGLIHRDLAPKNILLTREGHPVLVDFGLATLIREHESDASHGGMAGTLPYMAPEQLESNDNSIQPAVDIYGLGATLYHLITLRRPFDGSPADVLSHIAKQLPIAPRAISREIPRDLEAICQKAMEKRPGARFATADEMADELEAFLQRRPIATRPPGKIGRLVRWGQRRPGQVGALVLALLVLIFGSMAADQAYEAHKHEMLLAHQVEFAYAFAGLPALVTLEDHPGRTPAKRFLEAESVGEKLDEVVELAPDQWLFRWYRANYRSQHRLFEGARLDLEVLGAEFDSPLLKQLSSALLNQAGDKRWLLPKPQDLLPATTPFEHMLAAYTAMRWRDESRAWTEVMVACAAPDMPWSFQDFRAIVALGSGNFLLANEDALAIEARLKTSTSRTNHIVAYFHYSQSGNTDEALRRWEQGTALAGDQHAIHHNLGLLYKAKQQWTLAEHHLQLALELRPDVWTTRYVFGNLLSEQGHIDQAVETLEDGFKLGSPEDVMDTHLALAQLYLQRAEKLKSAEGLEDTPESLAADIGIRELLQNSNHHLEILEAAGVASWNALSARTYLLYRDGDLTGEEALGQMHEQLHGSLDAPSASGDGSLYYNLALLYLAELRYKEAIPYLILCAQLSGPDTGLLNYAQSLKGL
jgi:serine/threonine protein kinase/tetratricopeptide (TPR) repeat protein